MIQLTISLEILVFLNSFFFRGDINGLQIDEVSIWRNLSMDIEFLYLEDLFMMVCNREWRFQIFK